MKIVINKCYGGFGLSHKGIMYYTKLKGMALYPFVEKRDKNGHLISNKFVPYKEGKAFCVHYATSPLVNGQYEDNTYFSERDIERKEK